MKYVGLSSSVRLGVLSVFGIVVLDTVQDRACFLRPDLVGKRGCGGRSNN